MIGHLPVAMTFDEVLSCVINDGLVGARRSYASSPDKLKGATEGFETELQALLTLASSKTKEAYAADNYWEVRCFEAEVEWVCNNMSAYLVSLGQIPIVSVTARAVLNVDKILRKHMN